MITRRLVRFCYRAILGREPVNETEVDNKLRGWRRFRTVEALIGEFVESPEFRNKNLRKIENSGLTVAAQRFLSPDLRLLSARLQAERSITRSDFDKACALAVPRMADLPFGDQLEYLAYHRERFFELDNVIVDLLQHTHQPRVLDIGMSINSVILNELLPSARIEICDRSDVVIGEKQPFRLYNADLTDPDLDRKDLPETFDLIIFAEVLEHLLANPVRVLKFFLRHLSRTGSLIVTTPNFFSGGNLRALEQLENPQPIFPARLKRGQEMEFHVREYSMSELLLLGEEAGGLPTAFFYSSCWDDPSPDIPEEHRTNLFAIFRRSDELVPGR